MRRLVVFNNISLDGFIADRHSDMSWANRGDDEWRAFVVGHANSSNSILLGRVTYDLMAAFWPTPQAIKSFPAAAAGMNRRPKIVFSRTLEHAAWDNTTVIRRDIAGAVRALKQEPGDDLTILGSASIASQFAREHLIDEFQLMVVPVVLGGGKSMFEGVAETLTLKESRTFRNGNVLLAYERVTR